MWIKVIGVARPVDLSLPQENNVLALMRLRTKQEEL
jgi:hypothetical protein